SLRVFFPRGDYYDGLPCGLKDSDWLQASITMVEAVKHKTGGKLVIENGRGLGSGSDYLAHRVAARKLIAHGSGVQIEQFARNKPLLDAREMHEIGAMGKMVFAKCQGRVEVCRTAFARGLNGAAYMTVAPLP
ncbi:MAG TPA: hypothetical protein VE975_09470, partial [Actinomycetota bacterium]|nr:hypothetical protein [Actinomycetota bacterium]